MRKGTGSNGYARRKPGPKPGGPNPGAFKKGGDDRRWTPRKTVINDEGQTLTEAARQYGHEALETVVAAMRNQLMSPMDRVRCAQYLHDRGFGRTAELVKMEASLNTAGSLEKALIAAREAADPEEIRHLSTENLAYLLHVQYKEIERKTEEVEKENEELRRQLSGLQTIEGEAEVVIEEPQKAIKHLPFG